MGSEMCIRDRRKWSSFKFSKTIKYSPNKSTFGLDLDEYRRKYFGLVGLPIQISTKTENENKVNSINPVYVKNEKTESVTNSEYIEGYFVDVKSEESDMMIIPKNENQSDNP